MRALLSIGLPCLFSGLAWFVLDDPMTTRFGRQPSAEYTQLMATSSTPGSCLPGPSGFSPAFARGQNQTRSIFRAHTPCEFREASSTTQLAVASLGPFLVLGISNLGSCASCAYATSESMWMCLHRQTCGPGFRFTGKRRFAPKPIMVGVGPQDLPWDPPSKDGFGMRPQDSGRWGRAQICDAT